MERNLRESGPLKQTDCNVSAQENFEYVAFYSFSIYSFEIDKQAQIYNGGSVMLLT